MFQMTEKIFALSTFGVDGSGTRNTSVSDGLHQTFLFVWWPILCAREKTLCASTS